uniref:I/LWEQ domain-containing protein n=1 Tax=Rodentolepis nana TaxID=102285 RepID=A0A0R3TEL1_RODNA
LFLQVQILSAAKDTAVALRNTLLTAAQVQSKSKKDPVFKEVKTYENEVGTCSNRLLKAVDAIDMEANRGTKALISTAHLCRQLANRMPNSAPSFNDLGSATTLMSTTSSLVSRYLTPDELARATEGPLRAIVDKAVTAASTRRQDDALVCANTARHAMLDLVNTCKNLQKQQEIKEEFRKQSGDIVKKIVLETSELMDSVKGAIAGENAKDSSRVSNSAAKIGALSSQLMRLIDKMRDSPRLVMYFRVNSPEWRDVAEKYLGRHIAFHNHYESCTEQNGFGKSVSIRSSCLQTQLDSKGFLMSGAEAAIEAIQRIDIALSLLESDLNKGKQEPFNQDIAVHTQPILNMARSTTLAAREFVHRVQLALASRESTNLGRLNLSVALAIEQLSDLSRLCAETRSEGPYTAPVDDPTRVMPSRHRLLNAVRQVASASGEILCAVQSNPQISATNLASVQASPYNMPNSMHYDHSAAVRAIKEQTDRMSHLIRNKDPIFSHLPDEVGFEGSASSTQAPMVSSQIEGEPSRAQIKTEQVVLDGLQNEVERLNRTIVVGEEGRS